MNQEIAVVTPGQLRKQKLQSVVDQFNAARTAGPDDGLRAHVIGGELIIQPVVKRPHQVLHTTLKSSGQEG